ncbi:MAG TPA: RNA-binding cell elongation regulator Jag/EloR [Clostridiales bacterium]|nr:RNA-binding cell elongation regulator Jag/EloR [Clostridiales bacterium]
MDYVVEKTGKTVDEAVSLALEDLGVDDKNVEVEVLEEGNKGIFGIIGARMAKVRVTRKESSAEKVSKYLQEIFDKMGVNVNMTVEDSDNSIFVKIEGEDSGIIIGRRGETLDALQYLAGLAANNGKEDYKRVVIDIENYRRKREETLVKLSNKLAERVIRSRKSITLEPMSPYERRIIHSALQNNKYIRTFSVGDEPNRKVVITLK